MSILLLIAAGLALGAAQTFVGTDTDGNLSLVPSPGKDIIINGTSFRALREQVSTLAARLEACTAAAATPEWALRALDGLRTDGIYAVGGNPAFTNNECLFLGSSYAAPYWKTMTPMPIERHSPGIVCHEHDVFVFGGHTSQAESLSWSGRYNALSNAWETLAPLPTGRYTPQAGQIGDWVYVVGGWTQANERYSLSLKTWDTGLASMPRNLEFFGAAVANNTLFTFGGRVSKGNTYFDEVYQYFPPPIDSWVPRQPMPRRQTCGAETATVNGQEFIYVTAGYNGVILDSVDRYDPLSDTWTTLGTMGAVRTGAAVVFASPYLYVIGGVMTPTGPSVAAVERFDTRQSNITWEVLPQMPTARVHLAACVLQY